MRKFFKKSLAMCLAIALCLTAMVGLTVSAEDATITGTITTSDAEVEAGATTATVSFTLAATDLSEVILSLEASEGATISDVAAPEGTTAYAVIPNADKSMVAFSTADVSVVTSEATVNVTVTFAEAAAEDAYAVTATLGTGMGATNKEELIVVADPAVANITVKAEEHVHDWGDWIEDTAATTAASGSKHRECACGETETAVIPRTLKLNTVSLVLEDFIAVTFKANADHFDTIGYTNPYLKVVVSADDVRTVEEYTLDDKNRREFTFTITPQMLNDNLQVYLYATYEGEEYCSDVLNYTIASSYCIKQLEKATVNDQTKTLIVDLIEYASALQIYKKYNTENLANALLSAEQKALGSTLLYAKTDYADAQNAKYTEIESPTAKFNTVTLFLADIVEIRLRATLPEDISNVKVVVEGGFGPYEISSSEFEYEADTGRHLIKFSKAMAHQMDDVFYYTIYDGDTAISNTLSYSAESYVNRNIEKTDDASLAIKDVIATMMAYGRSADKVVAAQ